MTRELFWLTLTVILTGLLWVPYVLNRCQVRGLSGAMANPSRNDKPHADWANRLMFAHDNAIVNLIIFAPLVLILNDLDRSTVVRASQAATTLSKSSRRVSRRSRAPPHSPLPSGRGRLLDRRRPAG